ncbi:MAG: hypothetical protein ACYSWO_09440 [Planctomycetota bacterium]
MNTSRLTTFLARPALLWALLCVAAAQPVTGQAESGSSAIAVQRTAWDIGLEVYNFKYEESVMDEEGVFYGVALGWTLRDWVGVSQNESASDGGPMLRLEGRLAVGEVDYDGQFEDGTPISIDNIEDTTLETRAIFGRDWLGAAMLNTLYAGIGYRYLNDDLSVHPGGYERESNYLYLPLGYRFDSGIGSGWSWGAAFEYDILLWGNQKSHLSDFDPALPDVENEQNKGFGYRASIRLQHRDKKGTVIIEPFFRFWDIEDSEAVFGWIEPANETTEYGIQLVWMF